MKSPLKFEFCPSEAAVVCKGNLNQSKEKLWKQYDVMASAEERPSNKKNCGILYHKKNLFDILEKRSGN